MNAALQLDASGRNGASLQALSNIAPTAETDPATGLDQLEQHPNWPALSRLPMRVSASVPCTRFRIADLLVLAPGQVIETAWPSSQEVQLRMGSVQVFWTEFEVVEQRLALRLTRLA